VARAEAGAGGQEQLAVDDARDLLAGFNTGETVWLEHGAVIEDLPPGFIVLGRTENFPVAALAQRDRKLYGLLFQPAVEETPRGMEVIRNFLYRICGCRGLWSPAAFVAEQTEAIRAQVGGGKVLCALSGGVDSSVAAALVHRAVGTN